ncbi:MAG TPA: SigE family RNA polymerase sigma factor [Actinocatenispora sp.]
MRELNGFAEFVASRLPALIRLGYLLTGDHGHAEDLVQTALVKTATHWRRVNDPSAYTRRVMVHESVSQWRRRRFHEQPLDGTDRPTGEDTAESVVRRELFVAALGRLTPRQRAVIVLRFYEDLSEAATAALLGCAVGTVKSRTHHALNRLREVAPELTDLLPALHATEVPR